jgi:hypothetical protein
MPTLTVNRSDVFPVGTTVAVIPEGGVYPGNPQTGASIATGVVAADGSLSITNAGILSYTTYGLYANVGGEHRYLRARSTLDVHDGGTATGIATTTSGSPNLTTVSATTGAFVIGQTITGPGIPAGTRLKSGSGASWVMDANATASAIGVSVSAYGANDPCAKIKRSRAAIGTT